MYAFELSIQKQLQAMLKCDKRNLWLTTAGMKVYVRKTYRRFQPELDNIDTYIIASENRYNCIDLANIEVKEKYQRKGCLNRLIEYIKLSLDIKYVYIECVLTAKMSDFCSKYGFISDNNDPPSFYINLHDNKINIYPT